MALDHGVSKGTLEIAKTLSDGITKDDQDAVAALIEEMNDYE